MKKRSWRIAALVLVMLLSIALSPYLGLVQTVSASQNTIYKANVKYDSIAKTAVQEFTVKSSTDMKELMLYAEDGKTLVATWNASGNSTVTNGIRTWKVSRAIASVGNRKLVFKGRTSDTAALSNAVTVSFKVENTGVISVSAKTAILEKDSAQVFTVKTTSDAKYLVEYAESGNKVISWEATSGNSTVSGNVRTWTLKQKINTPGKRTLTFKAGTSASTVASAARTASFTVEETLVKEASVKYGTIGKGATQTFMVKTSGTAQNLMLYAEGGNLVKTWKADDDNSYTVGDTRVWKVTQAIGTPGNRTLTLKAGRTTTPGLTGKNVSFSVVEKKIVSAKASNAVILTDDKQSFTVVTSSDVQYLMLYAEGGNPVKTWGAVAYSKEGANRLRTWNVELLIRTAGDRKLVFKGGTNYNTPVTNSATVAFKVEDVAIKSAAAQYDIITKGSEQVFVVRTTKDTMKLVEYAEDGKTLVKSWTASGNSTVSGNERTWTLKQKIQTPGVRRLTFIAGGSTLMSSSKYTVCFAVLSAVPIDEDCFPDAAFRKYISENIDRNKDGALSLAELKGVTDISVANRNISSLQGIEFFPALKSLGCGSNNLKTLDLGRNVALESLYCQSNQLTQLDLSKNKALKYIVCFQNALVSLNVSQCTELLELICYSNKLTTLDVSHNTKLTDLNSSDNKLNTLDVKKNTKLRYLWCSEDGLTSLDISRNKELCELDCSSNDLTGLDLRENTNLIKLYVASNQSLRSVDVSKLTALQHFDCSNIKATKLDVSYNTALEKLDCSYNQLSKLDVSYNAELNTLSCSQNQLTSLDLGQNTKLVGLICHDNALTKLNVKKCTALFYLFFDDNQLTSLDLSKNTELEMISCITNPLKELDVSNCKKIRNIKCSTGLNVIGAGESTDIYYYNK